MKTLGDAELEIMQVLWDAKEPVTALYVSEHLKERRGWAISTVMTVLSNLCEKDFAECDRTKRRNMYSAIVEESSYKNSETKKFLGRLYDNSLSAMLASFVEEEGLSENELEEIRKIIE